MAGKAAAAGMAARVRVGILEDHQSVIDGYRYRLGLTPGIELVGVAHTGAELDGLLAGPPFDVLILDVGVPASADNPSPFPILHVIPQLADRRPELSILIISMVADRVLIRALLDAGARGYVLKDETAVIEHLGEVVLGVAAGGNYVSERVFDLVNRGARQADAPRLSPRQLETLSLCAAHLDWSRAQVAAEMNVSYSTVRNLLSGSYVRLGVNNLTAAIARCRQIGLLPGA